MSEEILAILNDSQPYSQKKEKLTIILPNVDESVRHCFAAHGHWNSAARQFDADPDWEAVGSALQDLLKQQSSIKLNHFIERPVSGSHCRRKWRQFRISMVRCI